MRISIFLEKTLQNALTLCVMQCNILSNITYRIVERGVKVMSLAKNARLLAGMSLEESATKLGIPAGYLSQIENGKRQISSERAEQIASIYNVDIEKIFLPSRYAIREVDESKNVS